jgi:hypothetical protein
MPFSEVMKIITMSTVIVTSILLLTLVSTTGNVSIIEEKQAYAAKAGVGGNGGFGGSQ